jgi:hypothetical protein
VTVATWPTKPALRSGRASGTADAPRLAEGVDSLNVVTAAAIACHLLAGTGAAGSQPGTFGRN